MSPEQSMAPTYEQLNRSAAPDLQDGDDDFHASNLPSMEELRARADIAEATRIMSGEPEVTPQVEKIRLAPWQEIHKIGRAVLDFRMGRVREDQDKFDLSEEDALDPTMFVTPKPDTTGLNRDV
ncbi:MAG TPA: hypothetical protein VFM68_04365 [Candidatus Saccharimonadales bacterium]|nr:hypothetical protein [Candidatus Saccharimonadales bacterium]